MKMRAAMLICTALVMPTPAEAAPVVAFFQGIASFIATGTVVGSGIGGAFALGSKIAAFFGTTVGSLLLQVGLSALLTKKPNQSIEQSRVNTRLVDAVRWLAGGNALLGGEVGIFGEYDADGNLWFIVAHADSELVGEPQYLLDGIPVTLSDGTDGFLAGEVITDEFCHTSSYAQYEGTGTRIPAFRIWTATPDAANLYGAKPAEFLAAFPELPADFLLAGVCYSVIRCKAIPLQHYSKVFRWRGGLGLGEPAVTLFGNFSRMYDPRDVAQDIDDPTTWGPGDGNAAIVWAWFRTDPRGRGKPMSEVNWDRVAAEADICDQTVLDRTGNPIPRYRCGVAFQDSRPRQECEAEILLTCDGFVAYDDEGLAYVDVGIYQAPTITFSSERDILSMQTEVIDDGEAAVDGVIVEYLSIENGYTKQPSAPWQNPEYYDGVSEPRYEKIAIMGCHNHNQAFRLAKIIGLRSASSKRAGLQTTIKGILAKGRRTIDLQLDDEFSGDFEIVSSVEESPDGMTCAFGVVPMQEDRYDLGLGEEGAPPAPAPILDIDTTLETAQNVVITAESVGAIDGAALRFVATFDAPSRPDRAFRFRYALTGEIVYEYFSTDMDGLIAYSAVVQPDTAYDVEWQTLTAGGRATEWAGTTVTTPEFDLIIDAGVGA